MKSEFRWKLSGTPSVAFRKGNQRLSRFPERHEGRSLQTIVLGQGHLGRYIVNSLWLVITALAAFAVAYRFYGAFLAARWRC